MATHEAGSNLTPDDARDALSLADAEERATVNRPVPWWYFPVLAAMILAVFILNSVEEPAPTVRWVIVTLAVGVPVTMAVLVGRITLNQPGYHGVHTRWGSTILAILVAAALAITPVLVADAVGSWIWIVCGAVLAALIAGFGIAYWRRYPRA
jgi:hypothetical protein